jgi:hypothetical protein
MIETKVASCKGAASATLATSSEDIVAKTGFARDQSLSYRYIVQANGARTVQVTLWNGATSETVIMDEVASPS